MEKTRILVRLPNWLGDMVMAAGALQQVQHFFPGATVSVIVKKGLQDLLPFFPPTEQQFVFSKAGYPGPKGLWRFGRMIKQQGPFDLYISFPDSFSSALMGFATGAKKRIGFKKEGREILLTNAFVKPKGLHRVEEYVNLLEQFTGKKARAVSVSLHHAFAKENATVINVNSEASSRRLTVSKAVEVIDAARKALPGKIFLVGGPAEKAFVEQVFAGLQNKEGIESLAGKTSLGELAQVLATARVVLTTDSGPAHLANALGTQTVVLFGAGNEANTAPYNKTAVRVTRLGQLSCEPCTKNVCVRFATPQCLERLETATIIQTVNERREYGN
ncbi:glycosyltransferase family 9 protein [Flavisolibacter nicotianae]|uniref:glycosyltransferase family 9 protein n=1 Tax=Flavisolibacter nicotianae TaxID=2364882 RepID=UPI000EAB8ED2|nr:glycosyltransferase family 9 protein [Flavisolibacter nicotianae]